MRKIVSFALKNSFVFILIISCFSFIGYFLYGKLPQDVFPNSVFPRIVIHVNSSYTPVDKMLFDITKPLEEQIKSVQGVEEIRSSTGIGNSVIDIYFSWETDPYRAYEMTTANISRIASELPANTKFDVKLMSPSAFSITNYALVSETVSAEELTNIANYIVKPNILGVKGVHNVALQGDRYKTFDIYLNNAQMMIYKLRIEDIKTAINDTLSSNFIGAVKSSGKNMISFFYSRPEELKEILKIPLKTGNDKSIYLQDIGSVVTGSYPSLSMVKINDYRTSVILNVYRDDYSNSVKLVQDIDKEISDISKKLPEGISLIKWYDLSHFISGSIKSVIDAIILGSLITLIIISLFLGRIRFALLTIFIIPVSILLSVIVIYLLKGSINIMSLGGLAASIGAIVDHAIVVMENIEKNINKGKEKNSMIIEASSEILSPMFFATITSVCVFIPLFFLSDVIGIFFKALALSVVSTLIISQILAIILTPVLAMLAIKNSSSKEPEWLIFTEKIYTKVLKSSLKFNYWVIPFALTLFVIIIFLYKNMATSFLPEWDEGAIVIDFVTSPGTSANQTYEVVKHIETIIKKIPEVENISLRIGAGIGEPAMPTNEGDFLLVLKDKRDRSSQEIMEEIEEEVNKNIKNLEELDIFQVLGDRLGDLTGDHAPFEVVIHGDKQDKLIEIGEELKKEIEKNELFKDVNLKTSFYGPYIYLKPKDNALADFGITKQLLTDYAQLALWGIEAGNIIQGERPVTLMLKIPFENNYTELYKVPVWSPKLKSYVNLKDIAEIKVKKQIPEINHKNLASTGLITIRLSENDLTKGAENLNSILDSFKMPESYYASLEGFYKSQQESFRKLEYIITFSIIIVISLLTLQFNSILQALSVLIGTLLSLAGIMTALKITGKPIDVTAFIGILLVISIVINNGILIFDYYNKYRINESDDTEALIHACKERMRPVLMTMIADTLGFLPIAFAYGKGTEIIQPMAISVMGGLILSIILSLLFMPTLYILMIRVKYAKN